MAYSSSSSSTSYASNNQTFSSSGSSRWTPNTTISVLTEDPSSPLRPLDLGPPGYQATIVLFENTPEERTVYLGPWEISEGTQRRILWQGSYRMECLEHVLSPADAIPHTLHARHRQFSDPFQLERFVHFPGTQRVRYIDQDGVILFDQFIEIKYEFTTVEASLQFQGDLRQKDLVDCFDVDVVWTDSHGRTDSFGNIRGMGTVQRLKLWSDRVTSTHSLTFFANRIDRHHREYQVDQFESEPRSRDDRRRTLRLVTANRRGSGSGRSRISLAPFRRQRSSPSTTTPGLDIRYLAVQFSKSEDYRRFQNIWLTAYGSDIELRNSGYQQEYFELPSPEIALGSAYDLPGSHIYHDNMPPVEEVSGATNEQFPP